MIVLAIAGQTATHTTLQASDYSWQRLKEALLARNDPRWMLVNRVLTLSPPAGARVRRLELPRDEADRLREFARTAP